MQTDSCRYCDEPRSDPVEERIKYATTYDPNYDPYGELREAARRLAGEYVLDDEDAFQAILAFSELGARRILRQRWWRGEVELRKDA